MGLLDQLNFTRRNIEARSKGSADTSEEAAVRLIEEGNAYEESGQLTEAMKRYESAVRLAPNLARGHLNRGNILLELGDAKGALQAYATALDKDPAYAAAHYNMGNAYLRSGHLELAATCYRKAIASRPDFADAEVALGCALEDLGRFEDAAASYRRALQIKPDYAEVYNNLGNTLQSLGQLENAVTSYRKALESKPNYVDAHNNLGNALKAQGRFDDAAASYRKALEIKPDFADAHNNLGSALEEMGNLNEALTSYRRALKIKPELGVIHYNTGNVLRALGKLEDAIASYRRSLEINPAFAEAHCNLGNALRDSGKTEDALEYYRRSLKISPNFAEAHNNLGNALNDLGRLDQAVASYCRAVQLKPDFAEAHNNLGNPLKTLGRLNEALPSYRRALKVRPDFADAHNNVGTVLQDLGRLDDAVASYREALQIVPDFAMAYSNLLFCLSHNAAIAPQALFAEHCRFGEQLEAPLRASWPQHRNARDPARHLQVGLVSGDFRSHAVAYFVEPVLANLAKSSALSLQAFYTRALEDPTTQRFRRYMTRWHAVSRLSDEELAQKVHDEEIDMLIDLSGHTGENRLMTFARKPAPVQASWIGYPGTTGLRAMDYYLSDSFLLPPGRFDDQFVEKLVQLPASAAFLPDQDAPPVNSLPAHTNGFITFGSFNRLSKLTSSVIRLWSPLLRALPSARLVLCGMPQGGQFDDLINAFKQEGVARDRLRFQERCATARYLELHHQIDICLDTYPYTGGTTTNHALWMGVPTLTLAGPTPPGRQGAAVMGRVGLEAFVASDAEDFQARGLKWARDIEGLAQVRAGLRERCAQSVTRRPDLIAAALESALRTMWRRWCAGEPPKTFVAEIPR